MPCATASTVGSSEIEGALANQSVLETCPNYVLPNVFTPNGDNCNDIFRAYSLRTLGENGTTPCGQLDSVQVTTWRTNCARFVKGVAFTVYNRWGKEVYSYESGSDKSIYIDWNGKGNSGEDLDPGTYYYIARVVFDVLDPKKQGKTLKGWIVILR